jgi:polysaccharide export outer membrane protein
MAKWPESVQSRLDRSECSPLTGADSRRVKAGAVPCIVALPSGGSHRLPLRLIGGLFCLSLLVFNIGCATVRGEKYTYKNLPPNYIAGVRENPQTIELTRLASSSKQSDVLDRGDVVEVAIAAGLSEKDTVRFTVRIEEDGNASIPQVGRIPLAGLKMEAAEAAIIYECVERGLYRSPSVTVTMKSQRTNRIMVAGAVKKPSVYDLPRGQCDLLTALSRAEGLDPTAGTQVVIRNPNGLRADGSQHRVAAKASTGVDPAGHSVDVELASMSDTIKVDLVSATKSGSNGYQLEDGAVVYVEKRDPEPLHVLGLVTRPGRFEFPIAEELRVLDAIALAGGVSSLAANKIYIIRRKPGSEIPSMDPSNPDRVQTFIIHVTLANAKQKSESNIRLQPGDVVSVEQTPLTFTLDLFRRLGMSLGTSIPLVGAPIF